MVKPVNAPTGFNARLQQLEESFANLIVSLNRNIAEQIDRDGKTDQTLQALIRTVGEDVVRGAVKDIVREQHAAKEAKDKADLADALESGQIVAVDAVGDRTLLVGVRTDDQGTPTDPSYVQTWSNELIPEVREEVKGKGIGYRIAIPGSTDKIEILDLYGLTPPAAATPEKQD